MAIPNMKSPGVYITEVDLSAYAAVMNESKIFGIVTVAQRGPVGVITPIESIEEFEEVFGTPISYGGLACIKILDQTSSLKVVRLAGSSLESRKVVVPGKDAEAEAVAEALIISMKEKGTLYSDTLSASITTDGENNKHITLVIKKGDVTLLNKDYSITQDAATDEYPYIVADTDAIFNFTVNPSTATVTDGDYVFSVGDNGADPDASEIASAVSKFNDAENIDIDIVALPGFSSAGAVNALIDLGNKRKDCVTLIDPPQGLTPDEVADYINGTSLDYPLDIAPDSSYSAAYYPWGRIYNPYTGLNEWAPPSVGILAGMAREYVSEDAWAAPAGITRFTIPEFVEMERVLDQTDRDTLYTNNVNPICDYRSQGMTALGQKTLQRSNTSLDRLNVRFLVNYIKKVTQVSTVPYLFESIDDTTFGLWVSDISNILSSIKARGGLYDYQVTMDWETVTDEYLNKNIMPGIIQIKPTRTAEYIPIDVVLKNRSDEF